MKKLSPYVKKRLAQIKAEQRKKRPRRKRVKTVYFKLEAKGFLLYMDLNPKDPDDIEILNEANKLILRRAA